MPSRLELNMIIKTWRSYDFSIILANSVTGTTVMARSKTIPSATQARVWLVVRTGNDRIGIRTVAGGPKMDAKCRYYIQIEIALNW